MKRLRVNMCPGVLLALLWFGAPVFGVGSGDNPALRAWYEQALGYYAAVMSSEAPKPSASEWQEFLDQMKWAQSQLGMSKGGWEGTVQHRAPAVRVTFIGLGGTHDIYSS